MEKEIVKLIFVDYQAHIFAIISLLWRSQIKSNKAQAVKQAGCDGKFNVMGTEITGIKKDVSENKTEIKGIKTEQEKIKISIVEKFTQKEAS